MFNINLELNLILKLNFIFVLNKNLNITNALYEINRNERSKAREAMILFVNNLSISNIDSIRTQAGMLSMLVSQTDEVTRNSEVLKFF